MTAHDTRLLIDLLNERSQDLMLEVNELKTQGHSERDLKQHRREIVHIYQLLLTLKERQQ